MQRLNYQIHRIRNEICVGPSDADQALHRQQLQALLTSATAEAEVPIPPDLHVGGAQKLKQVDNATMRRLQQGKQIALAARQLLASGAGNQRLSLALSQGGSYIKSLGAQSIADDASGCTWRATSAILTGAENCDQQARVAFEIARALDLPAKVVADTSAGHVFTILCSGNPDGSQHVVVDSWTTLPSSCLLEDSTFELGKVQEQHDAGDPAPTQFNLPIIARLRDEITRQLGADAIENVTREAYRQQHNIRVKALDRLLQEKGLLHYNQLRPDEMTEQERAIYQRKQPKLEKKISESILAGMANMVTLSSHGQQTGFLLHSSRTGNTLQRAKANVLAHDQASKKAFTQAYQASRAEARRQAKTAPGQCASVTHTATAAHLAMDGLAVTTVESTVTVNTQAKPMLWDTLMHSANILYVAPNGDHISTMRAQPSLIDRAKAGQEIARRQGFPDNYRQPEAARAAGNPVVSDAKLTHECVAVVAMALANLRLLQSQPQTFETVAKEKAQMDRIALRFDDLDLLTQENVLVRIADMLPGMHPAGLANATAMWESWQDELVPRPSFQGASATLRVIWGHHFGDERVEPVLRAAVRRRSSAIEIIGVAMALFVDKPQLQDKIVALVGDVVAAIDDQDQRTAIISSIHFALEKLGNSQVTAATQLMLLAHTWA